MPEIQETVARYIEENGQEKEKLARKSLDQFLEDQKDPFLQELTIPYIELDLLQREVSAYNSLNLNIQKFVSAYKDLSNKKIAREDFEEEKEYLSQSWKRDICNLFDGAIFHDSGENLQKLQILEGLGIIKNSKIDFEDLDPQGEAISALKSFIATLKNDHGISVENLGMNNTEEENWSVIFQKGVDLYLKLKEAYLIIQEKKRKRAEDISPMEEKLLLLRSSVYDHLFYFFEMYTEEVFREPSRYQSFLLKAHSSLKLQELKQPLAKAHEQCGIAQKKMAESGKYKLNSNGMPMKVAEE